MQDKKQIIGLILSVALSVGLVFVGANAATTVGNAVSVGSTLTVTGTTTLGTILTVAATTTLSATTTIDGTLFVGNGADLVVGTATSTFAGDVTLGNASADNIRITGTVSAATGITASSVTSTLVTIGSGQAISKHYSTSTVLDFGAIAAASCATSNTSIAGVVAGDSVVLGMAQEIAGATSTVMWNAWVPLADTVYVRVCNIGTSAPTPNFSAGTVRIDVWQH